MGALLYTRPEYVEALKNSGYVPVQMTVENALGFRHLSAEMEKARNAGVDYPSAYQIQSFILISTGLNWRLR